MLIGAKTKEEYGKVSKGMPAGVFGLIIV